MDEATRARAQELRRALASLRAMSFMTIGQLDEAVHATQPPWRGDIRIYSNENRTLSRALVQALDQVFLERLGHLGYPPGVITRARETGSVAELHTFLESQSTEAAAAAEALAVAANAADDPAPSAPDPRGRRLQLIVAVIVAIVTLACATTYYGTQYGVTQVTGSVHCLSGAAVNQVFAYWGGIGSHTGEWANTRPSPNSTSTAFFTVQIPLFRPYELHVGCGFTPTGGWAREARTQPSRAALVDVECDDTVTGLAGQPPFLGECR